MYGVPSDFSPCLTPEVMYKCVALKHPLTGKASCFLTCVISEQVDFYFIAKSTIDFSPTRTFKNRRVPF